MAWTCTEPHDLKVLATDPSENCSLGSKFKYVAGYLQGYNARHVQSQQKNRSGHPWVPCALEQSPSGVRVRVSIPPPNLESNKIQPYLILEMNPLKLRAFVRQGALDAFEERRSGEIAHEESTNDLTKIETISDQNTRNIGSCKVGKYSTTLRHL